MISDSCKVLFCNGWSELREDLLTTELDLKGQVFIVWLDGDSCPNEDLIIYGDCVYLDLIIYCPSCVCWDLIVFIVCQESAFQ